MTAQELAKELSLGFTDYEFFYKDKRGAICPFNKMGNFWASAIFDGQNFEFHSLKELMNSPFIDGKTLNETAEKIKFYG